jgi:hypothetical protein
MSRGVSVENKNAMTADVVEPMLFVEMDFESGFVRVHNGIGTIQWGGHDWLGIGAFGSVSGMNETAELQRNTVTYTLTGIPNDLIAVALGEHYQGRNARVYIGFFNITTKQLVGTPLLKESGLMDVSRVREGRECSVTITAESRMSEWSRPKVRRYTDAEQRARYPNDRGLEFVARTAVEEIVWGRKE